MMQHSVKNVFNKNAQKEVEKNYCAVALKK